MMSYGWRIPFLLSLLLVVLGLFIRLRIDESPVFEKIRETKAVESSMPLKDVMKNYPGIVIKGVGAKLIEACSFAMFTVIVLAYVNVNNLTKSYVLDAIIVAVVIEIFTIPLMGAISDKIGRKKVYILGALIQVIFIVPFFLMINSQNYLLIQLAMIIVLPIGHAMCYAPQASFFPELFPTAIRCSGIALIWQVGSLIGSGILGLCAVKILQICNGHYTGLALYVGFLGVASIIGIALLPETAPNKIKKEYQQWIAK